MPNIVNNFSFPVIADDNRNPQTSWENHVRRGSAGGVDLAYPYGSAVAANADGILWWSKGNGSAGWYAQLRIDGAPGWIIEYYHMSSFELPPNVNGVRVRAGQLVGLSGASGYGESRYYAPHLHVHLVINGVRVNLFNYFTSTAGGGVTPINPGEEDDMTPAQAQSLAEVQADVVKLRTDLGTTLSALSDVQTAIRTVTSLLTNGGSYADSRGVIRTYNYGVLPIVAASQGTTDATKADTTAIKNKVGA